MSDIKSPSAFAPQATGTTAAPAVAPAGYDSAAAMSPQPVQTTPQNLMTSPPEAYANTATSPPAKDVEATMGNKEAGQMAQNAAQGHWQHGFWDCFKPADLCFMSCCCPCFVFGKTQARLEDPSLQTYESVNAPCGIFCLLNWVAGAGWAMAWIKRTEMRRAYNIEGSGAWDCIASCCCPCCVLMQMDKEVVSRQAQGMQAPQGYQAPGGMVAHPQ